MRMFEMLSADEHERATTMMKLNIITYASFGTPKFARDDRTSLASVSEAILVSVNWPPLGDLCRLLVASTFSETHLR